METDSVRRRLLELAEERRVSLTRLSQMLGKNPSYLQQFVRKGSPRKLEEQDRGMLARFFGVDETELGRAAEISYDAPEVPARTRWVDVPRLEIEASAGPGSELAADMVFDTIRFSARWLRAMGLQPERVSAIAVSGDSMDPTLRDGDEILVERIAGPPRNGIHVVRLGGSLLVKRLETARPGLIVLISDNPAYPPVECAAGDVDVIGRVVWKGGRI
ncbi:S24 family peptidase [Novosphingobium soli]|uniref:S24 family peptidase n=1 Tax=Novosphingobium soli TaxID=574956 RepID=A0ABV6CXP9_9SPHN